jgi:TonB family protein
MAIIMAIALVLTGITAMSQTSSAAAPLSENAILKRYFERALIYPESSLKKGLKGKVKVGFEVLPDGKTQNYYIERGIEPLMDAEAMRLAKHILWKPALVAGKPVSSRESITIDFNPKTYSRKMREDQLLMEIPTEEPLAQPAEIYSLRQLSDAPQPLLPDEFKTIHAYLVHLMKYPEMAVRHNISGTVVLDFVIEINGLASNIRVRESVGGGCDQEAIRILEHMRWNPGKKNGEIVRTHAEIEIVFKLSEYHQKTIPNQRNTGL